LGNAWDTAASQSVAFFVEALPATAATPTGTFKLGYSLNAAAATYPLTLTSAGALTSLTSTTATDFFATSAGFNIPNVGYFRSNAFGNRLTLPADGLQRFINNASTFTAEFNTGTAAPTVANCSVGTTGTITTKSTNLAGEVNPGSGSTSCDVTFGAPAWTNAPFCVVTNETTEGQGIISARTTLLFTVSGLTAGDKFTYVCIGGI
jgi:hypothetical protein